MWKQIVDQRRLAPLDGSGRGFGRRRFGAWLAGAIGVFAGGAGGLTTRPLDAAQSPGRAPSAPTNSAQGPASSALDRLIAENEIRETMHLYSRFVDERKWELVERIFAPNLTCIWTPNGRREEIVTFCKSMLDGCGPTQHLMGSMLIDVNGNRATSRTYLRAFHRGKDEKAKLFWVSMGEYEAQWEHRPEGWRATHWNLRSITSEGDRSVLGPGKPS